jgi:hypothetical protein
VDPLKRKFLKLREVKNFYSVIGKVAVSDCGNKEGFREAEGGSR